MRKRWGVILTAIVVLLLFVGNRVYYLQNRLTEAVFLEHYYEIDLAADPEVLLSYITDENDQRQVVEVKFPELEEYGVTFTVEDQRRQYSSEQYQVKNVSLWYEADERSRLIETGAVSTDIVEVVFDNGEMIKGDMGEFGFSYLPYREGGQYTERRNGGAGRSNQWVNISIKPFQEIKVIGYGLGVYSEIADFMTVEINNQEVCTPMEEILVAEGEELKINASFLIHEDDMRRFNRYRVDTMVYIKSEGTMLNLPLLEVDYDSSPHLTEQNIKQILKEREL